MKIMDGAFKNEEWKEVGGWVWTVMTYIHPCLWLGFGWAFCAKSLQSCLTHCDPVDCSPPGCSIHGILQAWILERVALPSSRGSSRPRDQTHISSTGRQILYHLATRKDPKWNICPHRKNSMRLFVTAFFMIASVQTGECPSVTKKLSKCSPMGEWTNKMWESIHWNIIIP